MSVFEFAKQIADEKQIDGGPAFPFLIEDDESFLAHIGMTLRDHFAAQALVSFGKMAHDIIYRDGVPEQLAAAAYMLADAMLEARKR